jgi:hypothetical protein
MHFRFYLCCNEWFPVLRTKDEVNEDRRQGLRHVFSLAFVDFGLGPISVRLPYSSDKMKLGWQPIQLSPTGA